MLPWTLLVSFQRSPLRPPLVDRQFLELNLQMIPFGLKISWFILSLTGKFFFLSGMRFYSLSVQKGLMGCWLSLWSFGRVVGTKWASVVYCVGTTLTQGSFCLGGPPLSFTISFLCPGVITTFSLGVIYRMDPFLMADPFCLGERISYFNDRCSTTVGLTVQTAFISAGSFINMGVVLAFTLATSTAVRRPKTWGDARRFVFSFPS